MRPRDDHPRRAGRSRPARWPSCATSRGSRSRPRPPRRPGARAGRAGELPAALERLARAGVTNLVAHPPTLEELFLRHYVADGEPARPRGHADSPAPAARRLALRRDRVMIPAWVLGLGAGRARHRVLLRGPLRDRGLAARGRRDARRDARHARAVRAHLRATPSAGSSAGASAGSRSRSAGLMAILLVTRHTRAEEETGRAELVGAGAVGRNAPLAAALHHRRAGRASPLGVIATLAVARHRPGRAGALALGARLRATGLVFAGVAAVTAQLTESARAANGLAVAVLGASFALRAIGDAGPHWLSLALAARLGPAGPRVRRRALVGAAAPARARRPSASSPRAALKARARPRRRHPPAAPRPGARRARARRSRSPGGCSAARSLGWAAGFAILGAAFGSDRAGHRRRDRRQRPTSATRSRSSAARRASSTPTWPPRSRSSR